MALHNELHDRIPPTADLRQMAAQQLKDEPLLSDLKVTKILYGFAECLDAAQGLRLTDIDQMGAQQEQVLKRALETPSLTAFARRNEVARRHALRNSLAGVLALLVSEHDPCAASPIDLAPAVTDMVSRRRPMHPHEQLLMRLGVHRAWNGPVRGRVVGLRAAILACGAYTSEATLVSPQDFDDLDEPTALFLPGVKGFAGPRSVPLPDWTRPILAEAIHRHLNVHRGTLGTPLAYSGGHAPGSNRATAAASGTIGNLLSRSGLAHSGLTPMSIFATRIKQVYKHQGRSEARRIAGINSSDRLDRIIGQALDVI